MPAVTEARSARLSETTRTPFGRRVDCMRLLLRFLRAPSLQRILAREPDLPRAIDLEDLDVDDVALLEDVGDLAHSLVGQLRDVHEAVGAGKDLDEGAEVDDLADRAAVDASNLGLRGDRADTVEGLLERGAVGRRHAY